MTINERGYIANVGDSRAIMSAENGQIWYKLSRDHKPDEDFEKIRIEAKGGSVYQSKIIAKPPFSQYHEFNTPWTRIGLFPNKPLKFPEDYEYVLVGPFRVQPGRLSVSRTFGDVEAKLPQFGGTEDIIICDPDIKEFEINDTCDYIVIGWDGIFDKLENSDCLKIVSDSVTHNMGNIHQLTGCCVEDILRHSAAKRSLDNITVLMVSFKSLKKTISKIMKTKRGKIDEIDELYKNTNIDLCANDVDEEYMKEVLSWRRLGASQLSVPASPSHRRDVSVPISRKTEYSLPVNSFINKRYNSNTKNRDKYNKFKEKSQLFDVKFSSKGMQKSQPMNTSVYDSKKQSRDAMSDYNNFRGKFKHNLKDLNVDPLAQNLPFPMTTKRMELFAKELN
jgi:serine/threonine protein phosphatase PrpC